MMLHSFKPSSWVCVRFIKWRRQKMIVLSVHTTKSKTPSPPKQAVFIKLDSLDMDKWFISFKIENFFNYPFNIEWQKVSLAAYLWYLLNKDRTNKLNFVVCVFWRRPLSLLSSNIEYECMYVNIWKKTNMHLEKNKGKLKFSRYANIYTKKVLRKYPW